MLLPFACADGHEGEPAPFEFGFEEESEPEPIDGDVPRGLRCEIVEDTGYDDGTPFPVQLIKIDDQPVELETAAAFMAMREAGLQQGVDIRIVSGFRTMAEQEHFWHCYRTGSCNNGNLAAQPGFSNHQSGTALDLNRRATGVLDFLRAHAHEYGFFETVAGEPWHWDHIGDGKTTDICVPSQDHCDDPCYPAHGLGPACLGEHLYSCEVGADDCTAWFHMETCGKGSACQGDADYAMCCDGTFCDDDGHWAEAAIETIAALGITDGCGSSHGQRNYCPTDPVDRCQVIAMLGRAAEIPLVGTNAFSDDEGLYCEPYANAAAHYEVARGTASGQFSPNASAPRTHVALFIARAWGLPAAMRDYFADDDSQPDWVQEAHNQLFEAGLTVGCGGEGDRLNFCGEQTATRAELAAFLARARERLKLPKW